MKKIAAMILASVMMVLVLGGCINFDEWGSKQPAEYVTKYVTNIDKLDIREHPSNEASIICSIEKNSPVSFVKDAENGYSEIVYNGVTGYALAAYLTQQEPEPEKEVKEEKPVQQNTQSKPANSQPAMSNSSSSIISNRSDSEIEEYITSYVRPLYNEVNSNLNRYSSSVSNGIKYWHDGKGYIKKELPASVNSYGYTREYYYDTDSGRIAFAFVYSGTTEYRLYFRTNQLVRFIPPNGDVINNPRSSEALNMGEYVLSEAY